MSDAPLIVFAGTAEFAVPALQRLSRGPQRVIGVYTQPDRPAGRGRRLRPSPVKTAAQAYNLPVYQPQSLRHAAAQAELAELAPELIVVAAYGLVLPPEVLAIPALGCLNIHASLLPRWRGAAPIQRAIAAGDRRTGVTIMCMDAGLDTGAILAQRDCLIQADDTGGSVHDRLAELGAELITATLPHWLAGEIEPQTQNPTEATYAAKLHKEEAVIDWQRPATEIARRIRAFNPWPVAYTQHHGRILRVWLARALTTTPPLAAAGSIVEAGDAGIDVATGEGLLRIEELQIPGRQRQHAKAFLNGYPLSPHDRLG
ncbi:methionyl-tRNA formyltransferase [Nitrococcus mobilis]|uniref:Methionyl-tRNA formyltransferase n=1 Tax=Nitrococcus mobilis Nb-231 TaxID=314278 RepID=A4BP83_9GAMM|nr:methionyl-tRNA formyltransferase [Nitrococcus mobilis]EAR22384.1 methionyl-tRNA formyltransferase [Nitrococcus mobilis Nb-231]